ncbi:MAG: flagellar motor stator protein MotA [Kofleriaceae bacterium]|nr:flagellar motor stator protein MotA [Myxococcales bacterium]MCB9562623.1 flagellar motor stator protein MotA [Kofleriaceae bacterium]MCB9574557.1 flagellar motor stator protein MotA [Kofleriaceae bacterium]
MALVGILIVLGCVGGGFAIAGGNFGVLFQPAEFVVIVGAGVGALVATAPGRMRARVMRALKAAFKDGVPKKDDYLELLKLLYDVFQLVRRNGALALEPHLAEPQKSALFKKYGGFMKNHHAVPFLMEALEQMINGVEVHDLDQLMEAELETFKEEGHLPIGLIKTVGDSLPGIGIVAAVLGIIVTMSHMDAPPAVIGHHVAAALVGTFLGILLSYGVMGPLANNVELQEAHQLRYLQCIRTGLISSMKGASPSIAVEFARKTVFADDRPASRDVAKALASVKG